jgi:hypothetical protein
MKARLSYKATTFPANSPVVQRRAGRGYENFKNKQDLTDYIDSHGEARGVDTYLLITCHCGKVYSYSQKEDVPETNFICECKRTIIKYD